MSTNIYKDPREDMPQGAMSIYETEIDWSPRGKPYAHMVLEMHRGNQRFIQQCDDLGYFDPVCPWFDIGLGRDRSVTFCFHKDNPSSYEEYSCYPSGCPAGWLES